ncbi:MAG: aldose 1-epimerase family protein [Haloechinothrix sp.]
MPELFGKTLRRRELLARVGRMQQAAGIRLLELADGNERGVRVLDVRTGSGFGFEIVVDRGFDVGRCEMAGKSLAWQSPTGFVGPWHAEHEGFGFHRTFGGGLLVTCGLEHVLMPEEDTADHYRFPPQETMFYGLHGRISNSPGTLRGYGERWDGDECLLWAEGEVRQAMVFGEVLTLHRRVEATVGESRLRITDRVVNDGCHRTPHMMLYHVNLGWPLVDAGAHLLLPAGPTRAADGSGGDLVEVPDYRVVAAPSPDFVGQVFSHDMHADPTGWVTAGVANEALGLAAYQRYRSDTLPHHQVWRMLGAGTYVVALEPTTNTLGGRREARRRGELVHLDPGESRAYELELGAEQGEEGIARLTNAVTAILDARAR